MTDHAACNGTLERVKAARRPIYTPGAPQPEVDSALRDVTLENVRHLQQWATARNRHERRMARRNMRLGRS